ncbi:MAG: C-terminal helicase domain-containing protein [Chlamydia sp.]
MAYHGSMKKGSIESAIDAFQNNPDILFFATTMKLEGIGLNITAADAVLIYGPWWNRSVEDQSIGRAHHIGKGVCDCKAIYYPPKH